MEFTTIKLILPHGDAKRLRVCEIPGWSGRALAAPRTEFEDLLNRKEAEQSGVYFLFGSDSKRGDPVVYIGEAEVIRDRLKQHRVRDFNSAVIFVSTDESLTKAHVRYLENRLLQEAKNADRYQLGNLNSSNAKLPESDRGDMEVYLSRIRLVLPVLGWDLFTPVSGSIASASSQKELLFKTKGAVAHGKRTDNGFVVFKSSTACLELEPSAKTQHPYVVRLRTKLDQDGTLVRKNDLLEFAKDSEFDSPSAAASVVLGGGVNGLTAWKDQHGITLKELEAPPDESH